MREFFPVIFQALFLYTSHKYLSALPCPTQQEKDEKVWIYAVNIVPLHQ